MKSFSKYCILETKRFFRLRNMLVLLGLCLILLECIHWGVGDYQGALTNKKEIKESNAITMSQIKDYDMYADSGFRVAFIPSVESILLTPSSDVKNLYGKVNSIIALDIFNNVKGSICSGANSIQPRFTPMWLIIGILLAVLYGWEVTHLKASLTFPAHNGVVPRSAYGAVLFTRILFICLSFLVLFGISMFYLVKIEGYPLQMMNLSSFEAYIASALVLLVFFFWWAQLPVVCARKFRVCSLYCLFGHQSSPCSPVSGTPYMKSLANQPLTLMTWTAKKPLYCWNSRMKQSKSAKTCTTWTSKPNGNCQNYS
jgi:hypothetical protein